jgi:hypothetical protein
MPMLYPPVCPTRVEIFTTKSYAAWYTIYYMIDAKAFLFEIIRTEFITIRTKTISSDNL